ncbi:MAG: Fic family protein, partial [Saprospiraceae bacterium]
WAHDSRPIIEIDIKNLNKVLLVKPFWKDAETPDGQPTRRLIKVGEYKEHPNSVRLANGEMFEYTSPLDTPVQMAELVEWFNTRLGDPHTHSLVLAALFHYRFVRIHPFDDGNGRVARLLMNYALLKHDFPPVVIQSTDKSKYLRALNQADAGDTAAFIKYIGEQLVWSLELSIKAARGESLDEPDDLDKELSLLQRQLSQQPQLAARGTSENIADVIEKNLLPLYQAIEIKLATIENAFFEKEDAIHAAYEQNPPSNPTYRHLKINLLADWLDEVVRKDNIQIKSLNFNYQLKGFKSTTNAPSFNVFVVTDFNEFNYTIQQQPFAYGEWFSPEDVHRIIVPIIRALIERVKAANGA